MKLGIDIGASAVKLAAVSGGEIVYSRYIPGRPDIAQAVLDSGIKPDIIAITGVGAEGFDETVLNAPCRKVPELDAIGKGGCLLADRDSAVIASIGTGTAFVAVNNGVCRHIGGTGIGGGTLRGLAALLGLENAEKLSELALEGELTNVDLTIGELFSGSETLDPRLTASNLAKALPDASTADWAAGLANLVLQAVGTMSLISTQAARTDCVIVTGAVATSECARRNFANFQTVYGLEYIIPHHAEFATVYGAAMLV